MAEPIWQAVRYVSLSLSLLFLISSTASAQDIVSISGTVTTRADGSPVPDAVVTIVGVDAKATSDASGRYRLDVPRPALRGARIQLTVDAPGLPRETVDVIVSGAAVTVDVALRLAFTEQVTSARVRRRPSRRKPSRSMSSRASKSPPAATPRRRR